MNKNTRKLTEYEALIVRVFCEEMERIFTDRFAKALEKCRKRRMARKRKRK